MPLVVFLLMIVALIVLAADASKPLGWVALVLAVLALLIELSTGVHLGFGR